VTKKELYAHPGWESCTFEGARRDVLRLGLQTTFREKLAWLEEAEALSLRFQSSRWKAGLPVDPRLRPELEARLGLSPTKSAKPRPARREK